MKVKAKSQKERDT